MSDFSHHTDPSLAKVLRLCTDARNAKCGHFYVATVRQPEHEHSQEQFFRWLEHYEYEDFAQRFSLAQQRAEYARLCAETPSELPEPHYVEHYEGLEDFVVVDDDNDSQADSDADWQPQA